MKPLCIDLFCGLGGWTQGFLAEGYEVVGFDIERHHYGDERYPAQLVLQDVRTIHGKQFKDAAVIVASSPCQEFSYRAMPWKRAKALGPPVLGMELFAQAARIQREASEAAGHHIPMIQENVRGAQKYVGRAQWHYGSYYLWGDVPALMPIPHKAVGGSWFNIGSPGQKETNNNPVHNDAVKGVGIGSISWGQGKANRHPNDPRNTWSGSTARKAASARIAKIPFPLAQHIARVYYPQSLNPESRAPAFTLAPDSSHRSNP